MVFALILFSLVTPVLADELTAINRANASKITPITLVNGSYQGRFTDRGIPSSVARNNSINAGGARG